VGLQNHGVGPVTLRRQLGIDQLPVKRWGDRSCAGDKGTIARAGDTASGGGGGGAITKIDAHCKKFATNQPSNP
jgi:hypothetical protein